MSDEKIQYDKEKADCYEKYLQMRVLEQSLIYIPTLRKLARYSLAGQRVIDLACGGGDSTRLLVEFGAPRPVGVDIAPEMIERARADRSPSNADIEYVVCDCAEASELQKLGAFDLVWSVNFLNYSKTRDDFAKSIAAMFAATRAGGRCAGLAVSPFAVRVGVDPFDEYKKYNALVKRIDEVRTENIIYDRNPDEAGANVVIKLDLWIWPPEVWVECFRAAGFVDFEWVDMHIEASKAEHLEFFHDYFLHTPLICFSANRPA